MKMSWKILLLYRDDLKITISKEPQLIIILKTYYKFVCSLNYKRAPASKKAFAKVICIRTFAKCMFKKREKGNCFFTDPSDR